MFWTVLCLMECCFVFFVSVIRRNRKRWGCETVEKNTQLSMIGLNSRKRDILASIQNFGRISMARLQTWWLVTSYAEHCFITHNPLNIYVWRNQYCLINLRTTILNSLNKKYKHLRSCLFKRDTTINFNQVNHFWLANRVEEGSFEFVQCLFRWTI